MQPHPFANEIDRFFRHQPVGHQFPAGDRDKPRRAAEAPVVDQREAAADGPVIGVLLRLQERANAGVGPREALPLQVGDHPGELVNQEGDLFGGNLVALQILHPHGGGAEDGNGVVGDDDVAVGRGATAVEDPLAQAGVGDQHGALGEGEADLKAGHAEDMVGPGAGRVDHPGRADGKRLVGDPVADMDPGNPESVADQAGDLRVDQNTRPAGLGVPGVFNDKCERVDRPVGNLDGADDPGIQTGFHCQRFPGRERQGVDSRRPTRPDEVRPVLRAVFRKGDEQALRGLDAVGGNPPEDAVFGNALPRRVGVVDRVATAAVEEPLVTAGGAGGKIPLFNKQRRDSAQGQVACDAGPGRAAADDQYFRFQVHRFPGAVHFVWMNIKYR